MSVQTIKRILILASRACERDRHWDCPAGWAADAADDAYVCGCYCHPREGTFEESPR
jgi:hypothetical protein